MSTERIGEVMQILADDAVEYARRNFAVDLDFSESSLEQVEKILATLHSKKNFASQPQQKISGISQMMGGYVGEVIRRRWGGEWRLESPNVEGQVITLNTKIGDLFPPAKVFKRLVNGSEDNIWIYYQVMATRFVSRPTAEE